MVDYASIGCVCKGERAARMGRVVAPALAAHATGGEIVHAGLHALIAKVVVAADRIDLVGSHLAEIGDELCHLVNTAP